MNHWLTIIFLHYPVRALASRAAFASLSSRRNRENLTPVAPLFLAKETSSLVEAGRLPSLISVYRATICAAIFFDAAALLCNWCEEGYKDVLR